MSSDGDGSALDARRGS